MTTRARALALIVLALILIDVLLTVASCQRRNAAPEAPRAPTRTPTATRPFIVVGPIVTFTATLRATRTPIMVPSLTVTIAPSSTPMPVRAVREPPQTAIATILPNVLPRTGGCNP
jgi:hypothetical protein